LVKNRRIELTLPLFGTPVAVTPSDCSRDLWRQKTRVPELSYGIVSLILRLTILVQCRLVTDGRTDKQKHDYSI